MNGSTLLSIIIPTKNRYSTLIPVVNAILAHIQSENFEVVIQDNSDDNSAISPFLKKVQNSKLKYHYTKESISIADNTISAINNANGEYLIFIGDDDIVAPNICSFTELMKNENMDCLIYNPGYYWWNSVIFANETYYHKKNAFWLPKNISKDIKKLNSEHELRYMLKMGAGGYFRLPRFYHGIISRKILEKIKAKVGTYLLGSCPDIAFATSIACSIEDYHYINYPISVFGASKNSGAGWTASNKHYGKIEDQKFLRKDIINNWDPFIPKIWSEGTIYPQTTYEVLKAFKIDFQINYLSFYAVMITREPHLNQYTKGLIVKYCGYNFKKWFLLFLIIVKKKFGILYRNYKANARKLGYDVIEMHTIEQVIIKLKAL